MRIAVSTIALVLLFGSAGQSADIFTAGKLLLLATGARSEGLGGGGTLLGEAYSGLYNPAAQALCPDLAGSIYSSPRPYFQKGYDFLALSVSARSEFGSIGANYLNRKGIDGTDYPPEEASALVLAGRPWKKLALGIGFKILSTQRASNFIPINESGSRTYKLGFDLGVVYQGFLPKSTFGKKRQETEPFPQEVERTPDLGIVGGLALQNLGGRVEYDAVNVETLPQTFRADLLWYAFSNNWLEVGIAGELQKLLVARNAQGGYKKATDAFFTAWGGGSREGGWISRLGVELTTFKMISGRIGWSVDHGEHRSFNHAGLGIGYKWVWLNFAWVHESESEFGWGKGFRFDLTGSVSYDEIRGWMRDD